MMLRVRNFTRNNSIVPSRYYKSHVLSGIPVRYYNNTNNNNLLNDLNKQIVLNLQNCDGKNSIKKLYTVFNNSIIDFESKNKENDDDDDNNKYSLLKYSNKFDKISTDLLKLSVTEQREHDSTSSTHDESPVENVSPYEILNDYCRNHLIRPQHFEILMSFYLQNNQYQDILNLWIKYMQNIANREHNSNNKYNNYNDIILSYTMMAYISLPNIKPDLNFLLQFLNITSDNNDKIDLPFLTISKLIFRNKNPNTSIIYGNLLNLFHQYLKLNDQIPLVVKDNINLIYLPQILINYYKLYKGSIFQLNEKNKKIKDYSILKAFINRFIELKSPFFAMNIFNDFKPLIEDKSFYNELLLIVANLDTRDKLNKILAIWNSYIKPREDENETISPLSYKYLFRALEQSNNTNTIEEVFNTELSEELRQNRLIYETYWTIKLSNTSDLKLTFNQVKKIDEIKDFNKIESQDLIRNICLRMISDPAITYEEFDSFYNEYIKEIQLPINIAIKMLAKYRFCKNKEDFQFFESISELDYKHDFNHKINIIEKFIEIAPVVSPLHKLFEQNKLPPRSIIYKLFMMAEFDNSNGTTIQAAKIFQEYISNMGETNLAKLTKRDLKFVAELLNPLISGLCHERTDDKMKNKTVAKIFKYYRFSKDLNITLERKTTLNILATLRAVSHTSTSLSSEEIAIVTDLFAELKAAKNFRFQPQDVIMFKKIGIEVPEDRVWHRRSDQGGSKDTPTYATA